MSEILGGDRADGGKAVSGKGPECFSAKMVMEIVDDNPECSLEFPKREKKSKKKMKGRWE